jgi:hypothetical protein
MNRRIGPFPRWEKGEVLLLKELVDKNMPLNDIVVEINRRFKNSRTRAGVYRAIERYGKEWDYEGIQSAGRWSPEELTILITYYHDYGVRGVRAVLEHEGFKRNEYAIYSKVSRDRSLFDVEPLIRFNPREKKRPKQKLLLALEALKKALRIRQIVDLKDEVSEYTNIELSVFAKAAKQLIREGIAMDLGEHLIALPIKEKHNDRRV